MILQEHHNRDPLGWIIPVNQQHSPPKGSAREDAAAYPANAIELTALEEFEEFEDAMVCHKNAIESPASGRDALQNAAHGSCKTVKSKQPEQAPAATKKRAIVNKAADSIISSIRSLAEVVAREVKNKTQKAACALIKEVVDPRAAAAGRAAAKVKLQTQNSFCGIAPDDIQWHALEYKASKHGNQVGSEALKAHTAVNVKNVAGDLDKYMRKKSLQMASRIQRSSKLLRDRMFPKRQMPPSPSTKFIR